MPIVRPGKTIMLTPEGIRLRDVQHESVSSLSRARECMAGYIDHYQRKFREPITASLVFGRAFHSACEWVMLEKYHNNYVLPHERMAEIFESLFQYEYRTAREEGLTWAGKLSPEQIVQRGRVLLGRWREEFALTLTPADVPEVPFWIELTGCKRALYGRLDFVAKEDGGGLIDWKTSMRHWNTDDPTDWQQNENLFQIAVYHMGWYHVYKTWPAWAELDRIIVTGPDWMERVPVLMTTDQVQAVIDNDVKPLIKRIEEAWIADVWTCTCGKHESRSGLVRAGVLPKEVVLANEHHAGQADAGSPAA